jgi:hypothetical protein
VECGRFCDCIDQSVLPVSLEKPQAGFAGTRVKMWVNPLGSVRQLNILLALNEITQ